MIPSCSVNICLLASLQRMIFGRNNLRLFSVIIFVILFNLFIKVPSLFLSAYTYMLPLLRSEYSAQFVMVVLCRYFSLAWFLVSNANLHSLLNQSSLFVSFGSPTSTSLAASMMTCFVLSHSSFISALQEIRWKAQGLLKKKIDLYYIGA